MDIEKTTKSAKPSATSASVNTFKKTSTGGAVLDDGTFLSKREMGEINKAYAERGATQDALCQNYDISRVVMQNILNTKENRHKDFIRK